MLALQRTLCATLLVALPLAALSCGPSERSARTADQNRSVDEAAIRALIATNVAATNSRDAAGVASTYTPDGDIWFAGRPRISGPDEIRRNEEEFYSTPGFREWNFTIDSIRFVSADAALVEGTGLTTLNTGGAREDFTLVVVRRNSEWRIAAARILSVEEQP